MADRVPIDIRESRTYFPRWGPGSVDAHRNQLLTVVRAGHMPELEAVLPYQLSGFTVIKYSGVTWEKVDQIIQDIIDSVVNQPTPAA